MPPRLIYKENPKHKPHSFGEGPPRWFPDRDTPCPDELTARDAQLLLNSSLPGADDAHPDRKARYAMAEDGQIYKGYAEVCDDNQELWHGYPVSEDNVRRQVPARVLREFVRGGRLTKARYKRLTGSAR